MSEKRTIPQLAPGAALQAKGAAMAAAITGMALSDFDGRIFYVNPAFLRMWRCEEQDVVGQMATEFWQYPEDASTIIDVLHEQEGWSGELTARRADGSLFDVQLAASLVRDASDRPLCMLGVFLDITERKQVEAALRERIKELRLIYQLSELAQDPEINLPRFLQQVVDILPLGWQFPDNACAAIDFEGQRYASKTYRETPWQQRSSIIVNEEKVGSVVVGYLSLQPQADEGPFVAEERHLLDEAARGIGRFIERKRAQQILGQSVARYRGLFQHTPISVFEQDFSAVKQRIEALRKEGITDFRAFFEARPELVSECIALVKVLAFSKASLELYGARNETELQVGLEQLVPPEARHLFVDELVWIAQGRTVFEWEGVNRKLTGELIDIHLHWSAEPGYEDSLARVLVSIEDITARKRAEEALRRSEARHRAVSELTSDFAFAYVLNSAGAWEMGWVTGAFERITGFKPEEIDLIGGWRDFIYHEDHAIVAEGMRNLMAGLPTTFEARVQTRSGGLRWVRLHCQPKWDTAEQQVVRISGAGQDITEVKRMEREMIRSERLAAMGQVTAILAHEVQNPLQAIQSNLELLSSFPLEPDEKEECLSICLAEVQRLREITRNVLSMSRVDPGAFGPVAMAEVWQRTQGLLEQQIRSVGIDAIVDIPGDLPAIHGSLEQLAQVMINLTLNSIDSMPNGGKLQIEGWTSGNQLVVTVANDGPPIPPEHLHRLFEPFFTTKPTGTGLGLFVSHMIIHQHGGNLVVANLPAGQGVRFTITLPLANRLGTAVTDGEHV